MDILRSSCNVVFWFRLLTSLFSWSHNTKVFRHTHPCTGLTTTGVSWTPAHSRLSHPLCVIRGGTTSRDCVRRLCPASTGRRHIWGLPTCRPWRAATCGTRSPCVLSVSLFPPNSVLDYIRLIPVHFAFSVPRLGVNARVDFELTIYLYLQEQHPITKYTHDIRSSR